MAYKLLVLDIDGTVTNPDKKVLKETREAVVHLQEKGIHMAIASGRALQGIYSVAEELELDRFGNYILAFNRAKIINFQTKECIYEKKTSVKYTIAASERCGKMWPWFSDIWTGFSDGRYGSGFLYDAGISDQQYASEVLRQSEGGDQFSGTWLSADR